MPEITLAAEVGRPIGSSNTRRLRAAGKIPGVVYGPNQPPIPVAVEASAFRQALSGEQGMNTLLDLVADSTHYLVLARDVQRHPVRGTVSHVDFQVVSRSVVLEVEVPIHLTGESLDVRHHDYEVEQQLFTLSVRAQPDKIPPSIVVDITELVHGQAIRVGDLGLPEGVEAAQDAETTVVGTHASRVAAAEAPTAEAEPTEGAEATPEAPAAES